ncbi:MAG: hypothetical protein U0R78_02020 [Nocardioidaceae bacterium]
MPDDAMPADPAEVLPGGSQEPADPAEVLPGREEPEWKRRQRLAAVFGDVLPDQTSDDRDGEAHPPPVEGESASDAWLRRQVPPHHG